MREPGRTLRAGLAACAVFALVFAYFALFVRYGFNLDDEGTVLAHYYRTYRGETPYLDFHMGYTPGGYYFQALLFRLFGVSVLSLRWALAVCHSLVAALLFVIGRRVMPVAFALLPPLVYCAIMPFFPGEFASFNIPYPAWYGALFWVGGFWMLLRFLESGHFRWIAASGLAAGVCFAFKPNVGLFQLAGSGLVFLVALEPPGGGRASRWQGALWWALALAIAAGLVGVFASQASARDFRIFLWPIGAVLAVLAARRIAGRSADAPSHGLLGAGVLYVIAALVAVVPWGVFFFRVLGPQRFSRQVLFLGAGFEHFYYSPFHWAGPWDRMLVILALGIVAVGRLARVRLLPPRLTLAAGAIAGLVAVLAMRRAEMPEGLHAAVVSRIEDLSFTTTLLAHWAALAAALPLLWKRSRSRQDTTGIVILVGALAMYLQLYPRSDFMHLVTAVPLTLVLAASLAARFAAWFPATAGLGPAVRVALAGGALAFVAFRVSPNVNAVLTWEGGPGWRPQAALALERAPLTLERGRAPRLAELHDTVEYLRANTAPNEAIFPFPAIEMLCFLADRPNATRHGYFFSGWPGHEVEAEVVAALAAAPPRLVVVLHSHQLYFLTAPVYYYVLREFVQTHYRQVATFGDFAVLARHDVPESALHAAAAVEQPPVVTLESTYRARLRGSPEERLAAARALEAERLDFAWEPVVALLEDPDARVREAAIRALAAVSDQDVAVPLARALLQGMVPDRLRLAVLRRIWAVGDARVIRPLIELLPFLTDEREASAALGALETIGNKLAISDYWFGEAPEFNASLRELLGRRVWRRRLADPNDDMRIRRFLARVLPRLDDPTLAPALFAALGSESPELRVAAAAGLLRLGKAYRGLRLLDALVPLAARDAIYAPSLVLALYRRDPEATRRRLAESLVGPSPFDQLAVAWIVSATGDPHFRAPLVALLARPHPGLRLAALAGLARIADPRTRPALERAAADPDFEVREFAARALAALPPSRDQRPPVRAARP